LETPFFTDPILLNAINPNSNNFDQFLDGSPLDSCCDSLHLSDSQKQWINELKQVDDSKISLQISSNEFKAFFQAKQESTASSQQTRTPNVAKQHWVVFKGNLLGCSSKTQPNVAVNIGLIVTIVGYNVGL
jgi:hypothetical protein